MRGILLSIILLSLGLKGIRGTTYILVTGWSEDDDDDSVLVVTTDTDTYYAQQQLLLLQTDTSDDYTIDFYLKRASAAKIRMTWSYSDYIVTIDPCTDDTDDDESMHRPTMSDVPDTTQKNWTIYFGSDDNDETIKIGCNGKMVLDWTYNGSDSSCTSKLGYDTRNLEFYDDQTYSDYTLYYATADYDIFATDDTAAIGGTASLTCHVILPDEGTYTAVGDAPTWTVEDTTFVLANNTDIMEFEDTDSILSIEYSPLPDSDTTWSCNFNLTDDDENTITISATAGAYVVEYTMSQPWIFVGVEMVVGCVISNTALDASDTTFTWDNTSYTESSSGDLTVTTGDLSGTTRSVSLTIPADQVTADMNTDFTCEVLIDNDFTVTANATAKILGFDTQPEASISLVETLTGKLNCTVESILHSGTLQWWKVLGDGENDTVAQTAETTTSGSNYTSILLFSAITADDSGDYYCNVTYDSTDTFGGGTVMSTSGEIEVISAGTDDICVIKHCETVAGANCTGEYWETTSGTVCEYSVTKDLGNNLNTVTWCEEPLAGCALTSYRISNAAAYVTGAGSSLVSEGDSYSTLTVVGKGTTITATSITVDDSLVINTSNTISIDCNGTTTEAKSCSIAIASGSDNTYSCTGKYCEITYVSGGYDDLDCYEDFCSIVDSGTSNSDMACSGNNCTIVADSSDGNTYSVKANYVGAAINVTNSEDCDITTGGGNNETIIYSINNNKGDAACTGAHCEVRTYQGLYSTSECTGYNCTAYGYEISNGDNVTIKVECTGDECTAYCENSDNCTATCVGDYCRAICLNNTACYATCNGSDCTAACTKASGGYCETLELPKKSVCENCLHAPSIWSWEVCRDTYTSCLNCYTAEWDLLGLELYKLGCLDNITQADVCESNAFIDACYMYTCKTDGCTRTKMEELIDANPARATVIDTIVAILTLVLAACNY